MHSEADARLGPAPSRAEPLLAFVATTALASALYWLGRAVPFVHRNLHGFIALMFFYVPAAAGRLARRPFDYRSAGLTLAPLGRNAAVFGAAIALTFPAFAAAFFGFYGVVCAHGGPAPLASLAPALGRLCPSGHYLGWAGGHLRLPPDFALLAATQLVVVALPEEVFFRGYLLGRLEDLWPPRARLGGAAVGRALVASAALFALGHFLVDFNPQRLAVFFPGLVFGWMRARTGSLAAGTAFHASCNLLADILHTSFF